MRQRSNRQRHHYHRPRIASLLLLLPLLSITSAISLSSRRAQKTFTLLTNSTTCAGSITHERIRTFRRINPAAPEEVFDGILWDELLVNGSVCQPTLQNRARQSTYFRPRPTSPPGVAPDEAQPFFLEGRDNSPRGCRSFNTTFPGTYLFTDDLPTFRDRFERNRFLEPGVEQNPVRGVVYLFAIPIPDSGDIVGRACAYIESDGVIPATPEIGVADGLPDQPLVSPSPDAAVEDTAPDPAISVTPEAEVVDMPACFPGDAVVNTPTGGIAMRDLEIGDMVSTPNGVQRVVSFTHRSPVVISRFVKLDAENVSITLTKDHLLVVNGRMMPSEKVITGDWLEGKLVGRVKHVLEVQKLGLYAPVTDSGTMVVDGVVVSCYTSAFREVTAHALLSPVRGLNRALSWDVCRLVDGMRSFWWG